MTIEMPTLVRGLSVVSISRVTPNTLSERDTESAALFLCVFVKCCLRYNGVTRKAVK